MKKIPTTALALTISASVFAQREGMSSEAYSAALIFVLILFMLGAFIPYWTTPKRSKLKSTIGWSGAILAVLLIPSLMYDWVTFQNLMVVAWIVLFIIAIVEANKKAPVVPVSQPDKLEALERLTRLRKDGGLTDAEFETEKSKLMQ